MGLRPIKRTKSKSKPKSSANVASNKEKNVNLRKQIKKEKKRKVEEIDEEESTGDEEFSVDGLLDVNTEDEDDDSESDNETTESLLRPERSNKENEVEEEDTDEEDRELEKLIGEEVDESDSSVDEPTTDNENLTVDELLKRDMAVKINAKDSDSDSDDIHYVTGADGKPRPIYPEIIPEYESDDTDAEDTNTIGNIPISVYDDMPHIGYNINGKRIMRPATGSAIDTLIESIELPEGWTGLLDKDTGASLNLTKEEIDLIGKISKGINPDPEINPFEPTIEWFTSKTEIMPLSAAPEPKRRFIPSKHEAKRVMKIVKAIREGRIIPPEVRRKQQLEEEEKNTYDIWADNAEAQEDHVMHIRAPKLPPPTNEESYNPPEEYLMTDKEREEWENMEPSDREKNFIPKKYGSLRVVPGYENSIRERFERSLDLYLAPRARKNKLNINPDSLIPTLPSPKDLRPFPIRCSTIFRGHEGRIRTVSIDSTGKYLATGGDDGTLRVWGVIDGRELWRIRLVNKGENDEEDNVESIEWNPNSSDGIIACAVGEHIYLIVPPIFGIDIENNGRQRIESGWGYAANGGSNKAEAVNINNDGDEETSASISKKTFASWSKPSQKQSENGIGAIITCSKTVKRLSWHRRGDYFVTVSPESSNTSVLIHQVSKHSSQSPFRKSRGIIQDAKFHPFKPELYVATQISIRIYDLSAQILAKKLMPGVRWLSSFDIHPQGDNVITSSYDKRITWHDLDLSTKPYKTLRYNEKAVRKVSFHKGGLPLFCSASDDGRVNVFHGTVYDDLMTNPLLVPLKILQGHKVVNSLGVLDVVWHPKEPWLFSAGADGTARLWTT